jgi:hypothetical protein
MGMEWTWSVKIDRRIWLKMNWKREVEELRRGGVNRKWVGEIWREEGVCVALWMIWIEKRCSSSKRAWMNQNNNNNTKVVSLSFFLLLSSFISFFIFILFYLLGEFFIFFFKQNILRSWVMFYEISDTWHDTDTIWYWYGDKWNFLKFSIRYCCDTLFTN